MTAEKKLALSLPIRLSAKAALLALIPALAWAAAQQQVASVGSPLEEISWVSWLAMIVFAFIGWAVNDVDKLAELWNEEAATPYLRILARLKLLKTIIGSLAAGVFTYLLGKVAPGPVISMMGLKFTDGQPPQIHEFVLLLLVAGAAWQGARWFERIFGQR